MFVTSRPVPFRWPGTLIVIAALLAAPAFPQSASPTRNASSTEEYSIFEFNPFLGYQWFQIFADDSRNLVTRFDGAPVAGFRMTEDLWRHFGLEQSFTIGFNEFRAQPYGLTDRIGVTTRNYTIALNPVFHFTPRESKFRPFVTAGPALTWYVPNKAATSTFDGAILPTDRELGSKWGPALIYGGGIKYNAWRSIGLRFDVRGLVTQERTFSLPTFPKTVGSVYGPAHGAEHAIAVSGGISIRFGHRSAGALPPVVKPPTKPPVTPPVAVQPATPAPAVEIQVGAISGARDVCPGDSLRLEVAASGWPAGETASYQWMIDGQPVSGATDSSFNMPTGSSGSKSVAVRVSAAGSSKTSDPVTVRVKNYSTPVVRFPLAQTTIPFGTKLPLHATATGSECSGAIGMRYSASEGSIANDTFDSVSVAFDPSGRLKQQSKVVHLTATATDGKGGTGSADGDLTVTLRPEARRLDDIVFPANNARVNNCAKRLLLEQLTPMLRGDPAATVILIGHRDDREKNVKLDRARTLNTVAVLSAGTGICPQLELSRVKVGWVGIDQSTTRKPMFCGASTEVKEKAGQAVSAEDPRVQFRRVEVWFVPGGAEMPAGVTGLQEVPAAEVQKLGCPK